MNLDALLAAFHSDPGMHTPGGRADVAPGSLPSGHNFSDEVLAELKRRREQLNQMGYQPDTTPQVSAHPQYSVEVGEPQMPAQYAVDAGAPQMPQQSPIGMEMSPDDNAWYDRQAYVGDQMMDEDDDKLKQRQAALASMRGM
jgi:hypothetical protein